MSELDDSISGLAASAASLKLEALPGPTISHAELLFADTIGVIMGGARESEVQKYVALTQTSFGPAQILSPGLPAASVEEAAFVNGTSGTFLELDAGVRPTGHPAVHVIPAALAVAQEQHATGAELLAAVIAGCEVATRLFEAFSLRYPVHPHGHFGAIGAATAVARLRGRPPGKAAEVAATLPLLTTWEPCYAGATARNAWAGTAAQLAIRAERMAAAGFTGSSRALHVAFGQVAGDLLRPELLARPVRPDDLHFTKGYFKLHSACALTHAALDAILSLRADMHTTESVLVETIANNLKLDRQAEANSLSTRFSIPYAVAAAIVHRGTGPEAFEPDPRVARMAGHVRVQHAPDLEPLWPERAPARVTVRDASGERTARVDNPRGHFANPVTEGVLLEKFVRLSWSSDAASLFRRLNQLSSAGDCATLFDPG